MSMWKESYRLGVDRIDQQHMELFRMTEELVKAVGDNTVTAEAYEKALGFLKDYVVYHFRDEEEYQASVGYAGMEAHKAEHRQFTQTVLDYEKKLLENGFDAATMKDLAGTVTAWLIYHVSDTDQKIVDRAKERKARDFELCVDLFSDSAVDVMETMAGFDASAIRRECVVNRQIRGDVFISIELVGDLTGRAVFGFSKELALNLVRTMTMMELEEVDELVRSALCELTNISCGSATVSLAERDIHCDIRPPVLSTEIAQDAQVTGVLIDTGAGGLEVVVLVDQEPSLG